GAADWRPRLLRPVRPQSGGRGLAERGTDKDDPSGAPGLLGACPGQFSILEPAMPRLRTLPPPAPSLVVMIGVAASGKSSFCRRNFHPRQIVSSDACRERVPGDASDQSVTRAAFEMAHRLTEERLRRGRL